MERFDVVVIGAGILGLAHARAAARRGQRVLVLERSAKARGASVRNFGMVWPIGQPPGPLLRRALRTREIWLECAAAAMFPAERCGTMHVAMRPDELDVLAEFQERFGGAGYESRMMTGAQACAASPALRPDRVIGALRSDLELCIDPRQAIARLPDALAPLGVEFRFDRHVRSVASGAVELADGAVIGASRVIVCSGAEMRTLFPDRLARSGLALCKLQMMRTAPQPSDWRTGCHLAAGLTLVHYKAFGACEALPRLRRRLESEYPEHLRMGVHVLVSQNALGEITIGDSHEYAGDTDPFDKASIDDLVLGYLGEFFTCPDPRIAQRWHGVYAKHTGGATELVDRVAGGVFLVTGVGGNGMSLSFGLAEETIDDILADRVWLPPTH